MTLCVVGCSHKTAPLEVRERLAFSESQIAAALEQFSRTYENVEVVVLSTCNRVELYVAAKEDNLLSTEEVAHFLATFHGSSNAGGSDADMCESHNTDSGADAALSAAEHLYRYTDACALEHLFRVAAGLDSMVVGEAQILSQVKEAYRLATDCDTAGPLVHAAFQAALKAARRVACHTDIQQHRVSIPSIAVGDFAGQIFERFDDKHALVIGAGEMAEETLAYLRERGVSDIAVANRSRSRAADLAARWQGRVVDWENLDEALCEADLVVSATSADTAIVTAAEFKTIHNARGDRPLFILDLAVPRDFDPDIGRQSDVFLFSIDDLQAACEENRRRRDKQLPAAEQIIDQQVARFMADQRLRETGPLIRRLREEWQRPKEEELQRLLRKIDATPEEQEEIRQSFDRLINKLLHAPLESLRRESRQGIPAALAETLSRLFRLKD